jgi:hypothetical protein
MSSTVEVLTKHSGGRWISLPWVVVEVEVIRAGDETEWWLGPWGVFGLSKMVFVSGQNYLFQSGSDIDDFGACSTVSFTSGWIQVLFRSSNFNLCEGLRGIIAEGLLYASESLG